VGPSPPFAPQGLPIREYLLVGLCAAVVTFLITGVIRRLAIRAGAIAVPRGRDVHTVPIPRLGGVAMYIGVLAGVFVASQLPVLRRAFDYSSETRAVMVAGGLIVLVGALDDRFGIDALTKLAGQATSAGCRHPRRDRSRAPSSRPRPFTATLVLPLPVTDVCGCHCRRPVMSGS